MKLHRICLFDFFCAGKVRRALLTAWQGKEGKDIGKMIPPGTWSRRHEDIAGGGRETERGNSPGKERPDRWKTVGNGGTQSYGV